MPTPVPTPTPTSAAGRLPVLDDYALNLTKLAKSALHDNAHIVTVGGQKMISLDGTKDYVDLGRLTAFEKSTKISFEVDFSRDVADGKEARLVWNHTKFGLAVEGDGLKVQVATAKEGFKTINVANLGLNDTDNHTIRVIMDEVSNRLQVVLDGKIVLNTASTDLKFVGAGGYEHGWMLGTPWDRFFDGKISDFRIEAKADFVVKSAGSATQAVAVAQPTTALKASVGSGFNTEISASAPQKQAADTDAVSSLFTKTAVVSAPQKQVAASATTDAVNAKLAGLLWGQAEKTFAVSDKGGLTQTTAANAEQSFSSFADLFKPKVAASSASVVVDHSADRLQVLLPNVAPQHDDDLDAHMASPAASAVSSFFDMGHHDQAVVDAAPVAHGDMWHHFFDGGHALFA